jgi:hypothetical protein
LGDAYSEAIVMADKALKYSLTILTLSILKASATEKTNNPIESCYVESLFRKTIKDQKALDYKAGYKTLQQYIGIRAAVDVYSKVFDQCNIILSTGRQTKYGSILGKLNFNRRFNENGTQVEFDLYQNYKRTICLRKYWFCKYISLSDLRYGAELYKSLPHSLELSAGFRTLKYSTTTNIYTGIGWYWKQLLVFAYFTSRRWRNSISSNYRKYKKQCS